MSALTREYFQQWLGTYGRASAENDPQASANLFAQDACYYETPFDAPMVGREAIFQYWDKGARTLMGKESTFEILAVQDQRGIARWQTQFTIIESDKHLALDCLFMVEFNEKGKCHTFREWWHIRELITNNEENDG
jgi:hypothetical protein